MTVEKAYWCSCCTKSVLGRNILNKNLLYSKLTKLARKSRSKEACHILYCPCSTSWYSMSILFSFFLVGVFALINNISWNCSVIVKRCYSLFTQLEFHNTTNFSQAETFSDTAMSVPQWAQTFKYWCCEKMFFFSLT